LQFVVAPYLVGPSTRVPTRRDMAYQLLDSVHSGKHPPGVVEDRRAGELFQSAPTPSQTHPCESASSPSPSAHASLALNPVGAQPAPGIPLLSGARSVSLLSRNEMSRVPRELQTDTACQ